MDYYVDYGNGSTTGYYAVAKWQASHSYALGAIMRPLTPQSQGFERCYVVTTAGTSGSSEPSYGQYQNQTFTDGGVTWQECTGQAAYQGSTVGVWAAPCANIFTASSGNFGFSAGGNIYVASTSQEVWAGGNISWNNNNYERIICVTKNAIPPVAGDVTTGALMSTSGGNSIYVCINALWCGVNITAGSGANTANILIQNSGSSRGMRFENCTLALAGTSGGTIVIGQGDYTSMQSTWRNTTVSFAATSHSIWSLGSFDWNGGSFTGTVPSELFQGQGYNGVTNICGVDLSAITSGYLYADAIYGPGHIIYNFVGCLLNSGVSAANISTGNVNSGRVNLIGSDVSGGSIQRNETWCYEGEVTTSTSVYLSGGAADAAGNDYSWLFSTSSAANLDFPLISWQIDVWNTLTGSRTITIQIANTGGTTFGSQDIWLEAEVMESSSTPQATEVTGKPAPLVASTAWSNSTGQTWTGLTSPTTQAVTLAISPARAGYVRVRVCMGKTSSSLYLNPKIAIA